MTVSAINPYVRFASYERHSISSAYSYAYDCRLLYLHEGCFLFECDGVSYEISGGTLLIWQSGKRYRLSADLPINAVIINFDFTQDHSDVLYMRPVGDMEYCADKVLEKPDFSDCPQLSEPLCLPNMRELEESLTQLVYEFREQKHFYGAAASSVLKKVLTHAVRVAVSGSAHSNSIVDKVVDFIRENYALPITNSDIARHVNYHEYYVNKLMIQQNGMTLHRYLLQVRVQSAAQMLLMTDAPIFSIAEQCGFTSASHFSNVFRSFICESPIEYRKNHRLL